MLIAVPFFGNDPRFKKLLTYWFELHAATGTKVPAVVVTDENELPGFPVLRVDTFEFRHVMRPGDAFDRKGALLLAAGKILGPFLSCDLDAFVVTDPERFMAKLPNVILATRPDPWPREIRMHWNKGQPVVLQRQAGVMWFGDVSRRRELAELYALEFERMGAEFEKDRWREQLAWSAVAFQTGLHELPAELNWSHVHAAHGRQVAILHEHGETKWGRLA